MKKSKKISALIFLFLFIFTLSATPVFAQMGDRTTPFSARINHRINLQQYGFDKPKVVELQLMEMYNGATANSMVTSENQFNQAPASDEEWILMKFNFKYVSGEETALNASDIISSGESFYTTGGVKISPIASASFAGQRSGLGQYDIQLYPGSQSAVWYGILVKKTVGGYPLIRIGTGYDSAKFETIYSWFSTNPSYAETTKVTGITLDKSSLSVLIGNTTQLAATVAPSNATNKTLQWTSSNPAVATVSSTGLVKGISAGSATITAKATDGSGKYAVCNVAVVKNILVSGITLSNTNVVRGLTTKLNPVISPSTATNKTLKWISTNPYIATVDSTGVVKGIFPGTATVIAISTDGSGKYTACNVTVTNSVLISGITMANATVSKGYTVKLNPVVSPSTATNKTLNWVSINPSIATVDSTGVVKGISSGTVTIMAISTDGSGKYTTCNVTVK